jgi:hypothetical protein
MTGITELWNETVQGFRDDKVDRAIVSGVLLLFGIPSCLFLASRVFDNEAKINGYDRLGAAVTYLNDYDGANPAEAIRNAYEIVDTVKDMNPGEEHIVALEAKLVSEEGQLNGTANPLVYEPILNQAASDIISYRLAHSRTWGDYLFFGLWSPMCLAYASVAVASFIPPAAELAERNDNANTRRRRQRYDNDLHNTPDDTFRNHDN